ncbi:MAG: molybdopterin-dependent oxidoreductase [Anaerolineales bacterium]|nr:molybdopterin-dependent oxidoreductase [Anaerolineales bacterium]
MTVKVTRTVCTTCHARCGAIVHSEDNKILKIEGDPNQPFSRGMFCGSGFSEREIHEHPDRIIYPMKRVGERGSGKWERITWDEALDTITKKTLEIKEKYGPEAIVTGQGTGRTWNHWHCRINSTIGLEGWSLVPTHVCLMPHIIPNALTLGVFSAGSGDFFNANTMVLWGTSATALRSRIRTVLDRQGQGAKLIVIDVRYTDIAKSADIFLQPRPGTDGALALSIMHVLIKEGLYDKEFVDKWTYGFDELAERVKTWTPEKAAEITWVPAEDIVATARMMGQNGPVAFNISLGVGCMHTNAIQNGRAAACIQGLLGHIDVKGGLPIALQFSVMLDDKITLWDPKKDPGRPDLKVLGGDEYRLYKSFGRSQWPKAVWRAVISGKPWPVKMMVFIANDPLLCYEETKTTREALLSKNLEFIVVKDFFFSPTAKLADMVLPSSDWAERDTIDEELFPNTVISTERAVDPPGECWDDWKFFLEWGKRLNPEQWPWKDEKEMVLWRMKELMGMDMTWEEYVKGAYFSMEPGGKKEPTYQKYAKGMLRKDGQPGFNTRTGRIEFRCDTLAHFGYDPVPDYIEPAESPISTPGVFKEYPFILTTGHRLYSFFHSAWTNIPAQRELYPYPFVLINPADANQLGITNGEWVSVESPRGKVSAKAHVTHEIGKGVVALPRPGWRDDCKELGLPGYGWDGANPNVLIPAEPADPSFGSSPMKSSLCRIVKQEIKS